MQTSLVEVSTADFKKDLVETKENLIKSNWHERVVIPTGSFHRPAMVSYFSFFYDNVAEMKKKEQEAGRNPMTMHFGLMTSRETHFKCDEKTGQYINERKSAGLEVDNTDPIRIKSFNFLRAGSIESYRDYLKNRPCGACGRAGANHACGNCKKVFYCGEVCEYADKVMLKHSDKVCRSMQADS